MTAVPADVTVALRRSGALAFLAFEAGWELLRARIDTARPPAHYLRRLGVLRAVVPEHCAGDDLRAAEIGRVVRRVARLMPFRAVCLQQALAVRRMLNRRGLPATVHLGVAQDCASGGPEVAHAWVISGNRVVSGEADFERYVVIGTFS